MKKILFKSLLALCVVLSTSMYAQIPNASFQKWTKVDGILEPVSWTTYNGLNSAPNSITPYTPGYNGNISDTAAQMKVMDYQGSPWASDLKTGFYCSNKYDTLYGYLKSINSNHDTLEISVYFYKNKSQIGSADWQTDTNAANFYKFSIPIDFIYGDVPDSAFIYITDLTTSPILGDEFIIDNLNLHLPLGTSIQNISNPSEFAIGNIFPMPANDIINIPVISSKPTEIQMNLYDIEGRQYVSTVREVNCSGLNNIEIPVADFPKGMSFITLQNKDGLRITRKIIVN